MKNWNTEGKPEYGIRVLVQTQGAPYLQIWRLEPDEEFGEVWVDDDNDIHGVSEVICWQELPERFAPVVEDVVEVPVVDADFWNKIYHEFKNQNYGTEEAKRIMNRD